MGLKKYPKCINGKILIYSKDGISFLLFDKYIQHNQLPICIKIDYFITPFTKINCKRVKDINVKEIPYSQNNYETISTTMWWGEPQKQKRKLYRRRLRDLITKKCELSTWKNIP